MGDGFWIPDARCWKEIRGWGKEIMGNYFFSLLIEIKSLS